MTRNTMSTAAFDWHAGWRYGLMGLPLAFVALPLYVTLPNHYATAFGVPLATLGAVLLPSWQFSSTSCRLRSASGTTTARVKMVE